MQAGRASYTAEANALFRAVESAQPAARRIVDDPLAGAFLTRPFSLVARAARVPGLRELIPWFIDRRWPGPRSAVVARTRLIDDLIAASLGAVEQMVILGAGFDTRAYRLPGLRRLRVFEVDHPDTQAAKRRLLARALPAAPQHVRFVAIDFQESELASVMEAAGYSGSAQSLILWEGTTNYLTEPAVDATLRWCARSAPGSRLVFTYVHRDIITRPELFFGSRQLRASLERSSERFTFGLDPGEVPAFLAARGLELESDIGAAEFRARYYGDAARGLRGHEFYRVALARVAPRRGPSER
jgi:methyltransferase (TIGR00027 family)